MRVKFIQVKNGLLPCACLVMKSDGGCRRFVVDRFHALSRSARRCLRSCRRRSCGCTPRGVVRLEETRIVLRPVGPFRLLFGIQVIQVAEELIEAVVGRQILVAVAQMVLAELSGRITQRLERLCDGDVALLQADRRSGMPDLRQARTQRAPGR